MRKRGFNVKVLTKLDFRENFNGIYPVIAPLVENGKFKGYVMRSDKKEIDRKYMYNRGFSRYDTLVGSYRKGPVLITEGYLDMAKAVMYGMNNYCALLGWKATPIQLSKLQSKTNIVISGLDNTDTGKKGTRYLREYFDVIRLKIPGHCKDPGDMDSYDWNMAKADILEQLERRNYYVKSRGTGR